MAEYSSDEIDNPTVDAYGNDLLSPEKMAETASRTAYYKHGFADGVAAERARSQGLEEAADALRELVALKDGPRDSEYQAQKPFSWERARRAVEALDGWRGKR